MADYWFDLNLRVVQANAEDIVLTFSSGGAATDVTAWANMTYKAEAVDSGNASTIAVAHASMTKSDSGSGTTDTITIPLTEAKTDITPGKYRHEFAADVSSKARTIFRGTITIVEEIAEVP